MTKYAFAAFRKLLVVSSVLMSGVAPAATFDPAGAVAALDRSGDGKVELTEYQAYQAAVFNARDADSSTTLGFPEFEATLSSGARANARASFDAFDADRDTALSLGEYAGYQEFVFKNFIDANQDGFMTAEELAALTVVAESGAQAAGIRGNAAGPMALDRSGNGAVESQEFTAYQSSRFTGLDLDKSGSLSFIEFRKSLDSGAARNARASFDGFDFNKNRRLSDREFVTYHAFVFQKFLDKDGSGSVTAAEWAEIAARNN